MLTFDEIKNIFGNSGLSTSQVADLRKKYGANAMTPPVRDPLWRQYLEKFDDPIIKILLFAVVVSTIVSLIRGEGLLDTIGIIIAVFFAAFVIAAVWNGINCRALDGKMPPFFKGNPTFFVIMAAIVAIQIIIVQIGGPVFNTVPLSFEQWVTIIWATASILIVGFLLRVVYRLIKPGLAKEIS
jgi:magnesium-transporting ATPase (P-type)